MIPHEIKKFIDIFSRLSGIGPRAATRLAFYIANLGRESQSALSEAMASLQNIDRCPRCFFIKEKIRTLCQICADPLRDAIITITERETDVLNIEKSGAFRGSYLVIGPLHEHGVMETYQKLRMEHLKTRIQKENISEILFATSPGSVSDIFYEIVMSDLAPFAKKVSRLGRGIPTGGEIEFADPETLRDAIQGRR